ncbi:TRAP transporter large permease [Microbacterium soli]|uniref:TRAP transporter large permease n=2 Tax=Microbacterium soli TaxID=446075 RepID=A0ABP7NAC1_9MICO
MPTLLIGSFAGLMVVGVPLALVLAGAGIIYIWFVTELPMTIIAQRLYSGMDETTMLAIPLFIVAGFLMNETGLTRRMVIVARILLRRVYAGLAQVAVLVSMVFGGVTGAAAADIAAVGITMIPEMEKQGYKREFSTATITAASLMGAVLPPSIPFIIYGVQSGTSISDLFLAGIIPGVLIGVSVMIANAVVLKRAGFVEPGRTVAEILGEEKLLPALRDALVALMMPVVIIGGILIGVFTPTEAAAVAVLYALVVGLFVIRTLSVKSLTQVLVRSVTMTASIMLIVICSFVLNWALSYSQLPQLIARALLEVTDSRVMFLLIVLALLLVVGMPLDPVPALIIVTPILFPAALSFGVDPVHFGVVCVLSLTLGLATPPVGASLFVGMSIAKLSLHRLSVAIIPFLVALGVLTVFITFVPQVYSWLL